jgi:plastocyanin
MNVAGSMSKRVPGLLALVFSFAACAQQTVEVVIQDYKFLLAELRIKAGDTVKWVNRERRTSHSVLFPAENGLESERLFSRGKLAANL